MKIFLLFLLTILVVTAAPHVLSALDKCRLQHVLLKEIIDDVNGMKGKVVKEIPVENVITPEHCTHENFCKAGIVLSAYKAEELELKEKDWLLPRQLIAYTRNTSCNMKSSAEQVEFLQLLENIKQCAQKEYKKLCNQKEHSKPQDL